MKITEDSIKEDSKRDLYWTSVIFQSEDGMKQSRIMACVSYEYIHQKPGIDSNFLENWPKTIIEKWSVFKDQIFNQDVHYDIYATTRKAEANCFDFLLTKTEKAEYA